jgi:AGCS family alanine or glycine:cation symporter
MFSNEAGMGSTPNSAAAAASASSRGAGDRADDWRLYRYHRDLYRQRRDHHAGAADGEEAANGIQAIQHAMSVLVGGWGQLCRFHRAAVRLQFYRRKLHLCRK